MISPVAAPVDTLRQVPLFAELGEREDDQPRSANTRDHGGGTPRPIVIEVGDGDLDENVHHGQGYPLHGSVIPSGLCREWYRHVGVRSCVPTLAARPSRLAAGDGLS